MSAALPPTDNAPTEKTLTDNTPTENTRTGNTLAGNASAEAEEAEEAEEHDSGDLARDLLRRIAEDSRLTAAAQRLPASHLRRLLTRCHAENAEALRHIVTAHGWPTAALVGEDASTAALMILLHSDDLGFQLACRDLIAAAVALGDCPPIHGAYVTDRCAVSMGRPQVYGTRYTPLGRPYPVVDPEGVDDRRRAVGLRTMADEQQALRELRLRRMNRASA
ncbi:DUF6624 domain-containing protein [Streptomyces sp. NPDC058280]|uniref:DUF6624 domain-containing protein n=1 Tax=Streptomyces sp. NPDC058280 TaxID=3346419 RepID=UPI0036EF4ABB